MKCPNCGAEVTTRFCEYCGSEQPQQSPPVTIINNYYETAPQSTASPAAQSAPKPRRRTFLWVLGWIFIFPVPLTVLILRSKRLKLWLKLLILAVGWALYFLLALTGGNESTAAANSLIKVFF